MSGDRYVVVGLAHVRSPWFTEVARWATAGSIPVEFVKCVSAEELRARIASGRPFSAALLDGRLAAVDRDLLATLADTGVRTLVVGGDADASRWEALGATAHLPRTFDRAVLLDTLADHCELIGAVDDLRHDDRPPTVSPLWRGRLVAVIGRSGAGTSTVAAALAQHLADDPHYAGDVVLADLARHAHQAVLHDARDIVPGIQEIVEAHRNGRPSATQLRQLAFDVAHRRYRLVLGLRRPGDWVAVRSRAFDAALDGLCHAARIVVADTDADLEGEAETGSFDVQDRNLMARSTTAAADVVVVVATGTTTGLHGLVNHLEDLRRHGIAGERTLVVINRAPRNVRARAELTRAVASLTGADQRPDPHIGPVFVAERRNVDALHRDLARFPSALAEPVGAAVGELLDRLPRRSLDVAEPEPVAVAPGSLGSWSDGEATS